MLLLSVSVVSGALESHDIENIMSKNSEQDKVTTLLYMLWGKKPRLWTEAFVESLENCGASQHLAVLLTE